MLSETWARRHFAPSGATAVAQGSLEDPIALGRAATGLLDILPVQVQPTAEYAFRARPREPITRPWSPTATPNRSSSGPTRVEQSWPSSP